MSLVLEVVPTTSPAAASSSASTCRTAGRRGLVPPAVGLPLAGLREYVEIIRARPAWCHARDV